MNQKMNQSLGEHRLKLKEGGQSREKLKIPYLKGSLQPALPTSPHLPYTTLNFSELFMTYPLNHCPSLLSLSSSMNHFDSQNSLQEGCNRFNYFLYHISFCPWSIVTQNLFLLVTRVRLLLCGTIFTKALVILGKNSE